MHGFDIEGYKPGALADVVRMHMAYYHPHWGFGVDFEIKVASELAEFLHRFDPAKDQFLTAYSANKQCIGSISVDGRDATEKGAHIRWFIVDQHFAGRGLGGELMSRAIQSCDDFGYKKSYLTTFAGLHVARTLYESFDFQLVAEKEDDQWNGGVQEQLFERQVV